ncbi:hypothetical protein B0H67DRAFT_569169 [Lasiosphaeris hirsuta]|uniref:Uncharacterized protein n=1 Tax=Lasiosphaeris hirsuta TaxID=260670 RepID=A0AA40AZN2_9PEZI|nr:hypothetical protein B0H67DRAFT_569169 [Lasiosphaeris hirsuta]
MTPPQPGAASDQGISAPSWRTWIPPVLSGLTSPHLVKKGQQHLYPLPHHCSDPPTSALSILNSLQDHAMELLKTRVHEAASKNKELLRILAETDHAAPELLQQKRLIIELQEQIVVSDRRLASANRQRAKELKEHEEHRDSMTRRLRYKATGRGAKYDAKAQKEEREYLEALQKEHRYQDLNTNLKAQLAAAQQQARVLEQDVVRHDSAQRQLDRLHVSLFDGPTPNFPGEDERERAMGAAKVAYEDARARAEIEAKALAALSDGARKMKMALSALTRALSASQADMFTHHNLTDFVERNELQLAQNLVLAARVHWLTARQISPAVGDLPEANISRGNVVSDIFFDNFFSDLEFHRKIQDSIADVENVAAVMQYLEMDARARHGALSGELGIREKELQDARAALQRAREEAFEKILTGADGHPPPPYK